MRGWRAGTTSYHGWHTTSSLTPRWFIEFVIVFNNCLTCSYPYLTCSRMVGCLCPHAPVQEGPQDPSNQQRNASSSSGGRRGDSAAAGVDVAWSQSTSFT